MGHTQQRPSRERPRTGRRMKGEREEKNKVYAQRYTRKGRRRRKAEHEDLRAERERRIWPRLRKMCVYVGVRTLWADI